MNNHEKILDTLKIPKDKLEHGAYYGGRCRNATVARWNAKEQQFYHWREKWGNTFIETIKHPDDEQVWDVFYPLELIEKPDKTIPFTDEDLFVVGY